MLLESAVKLPHKLVSDLSVFRIQKLELELAQMGYERRGKTRRADDYSVILWNVHQGSPVVRFSKSHTLASSCRVVQTTAGSVVEPL